MTSFGSALSAGYGSSGLRDWKSAGGAQTYFVYDGVMPVLELDAGGSVVAVTTSAGDTPLTRHDASGSVFYAFDPMGGLAHRMDSTGTVLSSHAFDAFGAPNSTVATTDPYACFNAASGYRSDPETGMLLAGHRYYDPSAGRFINRDPIGQSGGLDQYRYCANDPVMGSDPSGLFEIGGLDFTLEGARAGWETSKAAIGNSLSFGYFDNGCHDNEPGYTAAKHCMEAGLAPIAAYMGWTAGSAIIPTVATYVGLAPIAGRLLAARPETTEEVFQEEAPQIAQLQLNQQVGNAWRDEVADFLRSNPANQLVDTEVGFKTPFGWRFLDVVVYRNGFPIGGIEAKAGDSAYTAAQRAKDFYITMRFGFPINLVRAP